ncbi:hypothetical protein RF11_01336 [Thelohanellus kitauei]|uniref:Integrase catalytic domain-containing protein n=1 Tax=Thelohanellus kitauei TaxID=669202 RepID=A0A0C2MRX2_THEKT|nr:hypothetical protein RF11_01336 [Thelohanellus kitauei]
MLHINEVITKLSNAGLKLKKQKCKFAVEELNFLGFIWKRPINIKELQIFIGVCNYYSRFLGGFADIAQPLYRLLQKSHSWIWTNSCESSFEKLKEMIANITPLSYLKWEIPFRLSCDASDHGIGAVLSQKIHNVDRPVPFFSKILNSTQLRYCTTDREMLAIMLSIRKFRHYLLGKKFILLSDHNPLSYLKTMKHTNGCSTIWLMELEEYDFEFEFINGKRNVIADGLSRCASATLLESSVDLDIKQENDENIKKVKELLSITIPHHVRYDLFKYFHRQSISHFGINKTLSAILEVAYWPYIKQDIIEWINQCPSCQIDKSKNFKPRCSLRQIATDPSTDPWEVYFTGPLPSTNSGNKYIIVFINAFTKWVDAKAVLDQTVQTASKALIEPMVSRFGIPHQIHYDQGKHFESSVFQGICSSSGIKKSHTTPCHPSGNGLVERQNRTIKEMLRHHVNSHRSNWDEHLHKVLLATRIAKHLSTRFSPADLTYGKQLRSGANVEYPKINITIRQQSRDDEIPQKQEYLKSLFSGPFIILENIHPNYKIAAPQKIAQHYRIHHDHLYPFKGGGMNVA